MLTAFPSPRGDSLSHHVAAAPRRVAGPAGERRVPPRVCRCGTAQGLERVQMTAHPANASGLNFAAFPHGKSLTAYHEAGHAVVGLAIGCRIREARIAGDYIVRWSAVPDDLAKHQRCGLFLAGWVAESIWLNDPLPDDEHWYDAFDRARDGKTGHCDECKIARILVSSHPDADTPALLIQARRYTGSTRLFLGRHWSSVERIAHALLATGFLDDAECRSLVAEFP
jgi:hypothetical protein